GKVADPGQTGEQLAGIREFNERLASDARFDIAMIPVADGMTLARKK
ncbi:MAG: O-methyltransferase, partial [Pseudomonadota bacterium]